MATSVATHREISSEQRSTAAQLAVLQTSERRWAYALLRLVLGIDLLGHGVARIYHGVPAFAAGVTAQMSSPLLPAPMVHAFALSIPWIELTLGVLLTLALFTRATLSAAMLFMTILMIGVTIRQDWPTAGFQLVYGFVIFTLLFLRLPYSTTWPALLAGDGDATAGPGARV